MSAPSTRSSRVLPLAFLGVLTVCLGLAVYFLGILISLVRFALPLGGVAQGIGERLIRYSEIPNTIGLILAFLDLAFLFPGKRREARRTTLPEIRNRRLIVALTAYNDELSIAQAVRDFRSYPAVERVIVVDNGSRDRTSELARAEGAETVLEPQSGYGRCVYRCYREALRYPNELIVLCEGDCTFRAHDLEKFLAYLDHASIVNGTRIVEQLREYSTQLSTLMYYGNFFVGKLLEVKHLGRGTFTDVGTTYKMLRRDSLERLMPLLDPSVNLEFNAHFLDVALGAGESIVECPVTFHPRVGISKGGNTNNLRALKVGLTMILGLCFGWPRLLPGRRKS